jgi:hypothetical protein
VYDAWMMDMIGVYWKCSNEFSDRLMSICVIIHWPDNCSCTY